MVSLLVEKVNIKWLCRILGVDEKGFVSMMVVWYDALSDEGRELFDREARK